MTAYIQLPVVVIMILCLAALFMFGAEAYTHYAKHRLGVNLVLHRKPMCVVFLAALVVNIVLCLLVALFYRTELQTAVSSAAAQMTDTLIGDRQLAAGHSFYVDSLSAYAVLCVSFVALVAAMRTMADKQNKLTASKIACMLLVVASVEATYYSSSYYSIFFFMLMSQIASYGLFRHTAGRRNRMTALVLHNLFRLVGMLLLLAGIIMLSARYSPSITRLISRTIEIGWYEKIMFALIFSALVAFFLRPASGSSDTLYRICFVMRSQVIFFVFVRTLFAVFSSVSGLEKVPNILIVIGGVTILCALFMAVLSRLPSKLCGCMELFMKGFLLTAAGVAFYGCFNAEVLAKYGFTALEALLVLWLLYLPVFSLIAILSEHIERKIPQGIELYKYGGLLSLTPYAAALLFFMLFCVSGMPPLVTYPFMQLLFRSATFVSPFLSIFLVMTVWIMFFIGLYEIAAVAFGRNWNRKYRASIAVRDREILLSSGILTLWIVIMSLFPGLMLQKFVIPSVEALMNTGSSINVIEETQR